MVQAEKIHILLVEDTPSDVRLTQEALKDSDFTYELTVVTDGEQAMEYFKKVAGTAQQLDLVLLDLNMPKKNGHEVLAEMKEIEQLKHVPVILLTVSRDEHDILKALHLKMNYYLGKPVTSDKLNILVKAIHDLQSDEATGKSLTGEDAHVRYVMAGNPHTSPAILEKLAGEENPRIRMRVAENSQTPADLLQLLVSDPHPEVRLGVAENPNISLDLLERLAADPSEDVRLGIASNPKTPLQILKNLSNDDNVHVAASAKKTLGLLEAQRS